MISTRLRACSAAGLLAAAGCASAGGGSRAELLAGGRLIDGRQCAVAADPERLPAAAELVDAGAFGADAARLWVDAGRPAGYVLFALRHDGEGTQVRRAVIESTLPPALTDTLQKLVYAYRRQAPAARGEWGVRLRVEAGEPVGFQVARRMECTARPRDAAYRIADSGFDVRDTGVDATRTDGALAWVHVRLTAQGNVTDARIERGVWVRGAWEQQRLLSYVRGMSFWPALDDGVPVPSETTIPVRLSQTR
ncbi:MAG TPA: hypothetical protein VF092_03355 [Longimicrobium sp.]